MTVKCTCFPQRSPANRQLRKAGPSPCCSVPSMRLLLQITNAAPWNCSSLAAGLNVLTLPSPLERNLRRVCKLNTNIETKKGSESSCSRGVQQVCEDVQLPERLWTHTRIRLTCSHVFIQAKSDFFGAGRLQLVQL